MRVTLTLVQINVRNSQVVIMQIQCRNQYLLFSLNLAQTGLAGARACPHNGLVSGGVCWEILAGFWSFEGLFSSFYGYFEHIFHSCWPHVGTAHNRD